MRLNKPMLSSTKSPTCIAEEKRAVLKAAKEAVGGKVPLIAGVSELTTPAAVAYARDAERIGVDGLMVLPAMVYVPAAAELTNHFRMVARATSLPIMLYNNPPAYRVNIGRETLSELSNERNIVALKESAPDPRRFTDLINAFGDRFVLHAAIAREDEQLASILPQAHERAAQ